MDLRASIRSFLQSRAVWRFKQNKGAIIGLIIIIIIVFCALFAEYIMPYDPIEINKDEKLLHPSLEHLFGTDDLGRDIFSRVIYGCRVSLRVASLSVVLALIVGIPLGLVAGYYGRVVDNIIMRVMDIIFAFPDILLALTVVSIMGRGMTNVSIALGIVYTPIFVRLIRGLVLSIREMPYIEAAKAIGEKEWRIMFQEILPNCAAPLIVQATLTISYAILAEAALSFLGLGTQPPIPSWGRMLSEGRVFMRSMPWIAVFPGLACMISVLAFNLFGDGLEDALNPRR